MDEIEGLRKLETCQRKGEKKLKTKEEKEFNKKRK